MDGKDGKAPMFHVDLGSSQYFLSLSTTFYEDYHSLIINILWKHILAVKWTIANGRFHQNLEYPKTIGFSIDR
jgi:hypothetical protein